MLYFSKIATVFITPLGLCIGLMLLGLVLMAVRLRRSGVGFIVLGTALLWVGAMPVTARFLLGSLERQYPPAAMSSIPSADVAIVLGGAVGGPVPPRQTVDLGEASDRVYHAFELFSAGKVRTILISGGNLPWSPAAEPEAETIRKLLRSWGVPDDAIVTAGTSRTTAENAREVAALWPSLGFQSALLVPCQCKLLLKGDKCKFHGGCSTGPKSPEGRARIAEANRRRWAAWRAERESRPPTSAPAGQDEGHGHE